MSGPAPCRSIPARSTSARNRTYSSLCDRAARSSAGTAIAARRPPDGAGGLVRVLEVERTELVDRGRQLGFGGRLRAVWCAASVSTSCSQHRRSEGRHHGTTDASA